ncbi:hypothetical protein FRC03_006420 [Tulasnella sp. 419]|nr:hypothetical protein FRC03_006420 [Tulasnella sp. 419]
MYDPVCQLFNAIGGFMSAVASGKPTDEGIASSPYIWINNHNSGTSTAPNFQCYPDVCMVRNVPQVLEKGFQMEEVLVSSDIKRKLQLDEVVDQMVDQYKSLASVQINRCFAYGISLHYPEFQLWRTDRGGVISSEITNMKEEVKVLIHIIGRLMLSEYPDLGYYGSTFVSGESPGGPWVRFQTTKAFAEPDSVASAEEEAGGVDVPGAGPAKSPPDRQDKLVEMCLEITEVIKESRGWIGRCTYVAKAKSNNGQVYALKASWQDTSRTSEGRFYLQARNSGVITGLAEIAGYQELPPLSSFRTKLDGFEFEDRIQCRLLLTTIGEPLERATSIRQLVEAVKDAVICHRDLVFKAGLLHRDVSYSNVQLNDTNKHPKVGHGFLIDLEYAKEIGRTYNNSMRHARTANLPFMATACLKDSPPVQQVHHDLESFLWVVLYTCSDGPAWDLVKPLRETTPTYVLNRTFQQTTMFNCRALKRAFMRKDLDELSSIVVSKRFEPLVPYLERLRDLFVLGHPKWPDLDPNISPPTHEDFLSIISSALEDPGIQNAIPFGPDDFPTPVPTTRQPFTRSTSETSSSSDSSQEIIRHSPSSSSPGLGLKRQRFATADEETEAAEAQDPKRRRTQDE